MENTLLNLVPASYLPEVHLSQYDVGRELKFTLKDGSSDYTVPSGAVVTVKATKPSGLGFVVNAVAEGSVVTLSNTETMTNENGRFPAELSITQGSTVIGTSNFIFNIERSPHPEGTIDGDAESLLPELTLLVERIEAAADSVDEDTQTVTEAKAEVLQAKADTLQAKADTLTARDDALQAKDDTIAAKESAEASAQAAAEASERAEELIGSVSTKADAIVKTASGEIASFSDGGDDLPMKSLKVNIEPKQSGSGDPSPSNVRPISGYTDVNANVAGGNIFDKNLYPFLHDDSNKGWFISGSSLRKGTGVENATLGMPCKPNAKYKITFTIGYPLARIAYGKMADLSFQTGSTNQTVYNTQADTTTIGYREVIYQTGADATFLFIQLPYGYHEEGVNSLTIQEITNTYTTSLGQTVYGGTLDVVSGELVIDSAKIVYDGTLPIALINWSPSSNGVGWAYGYIRSNNKIVDGSVVPKIYSDKLKASSYDDMFNKRTTDCVGVYTNDAYGIFIRTSDTSLTTVEAVNSYLSANPITVVYELATPTIINLTPTQVKTLLGNNNIFADSGSVEVEYRADTTLAYNELVAMILENIGN